MLVGRGDHAVALDTLRTLRHEGFAVQSVTVGGVRIEVVPPFPSLVPQQTSTGEAPKQRTYLDDYATPAIRKVLGEDVEPDADGDVPA